MGNAQPSNQVEHLLSKEMSEFGYPEPLQAIALQAWQLFYEAEKPQIRSPSAHAAAVEYALMPQFVLGLSLTQKEVAERYGTTAASVSRLSNKLLDFLEGISLESVLSMVMDSDAPVELSALPDGENIAALPRELEEVLPQASSDGGPAAAGETETSLLSDVLLERVKRLPQTKENWAGGRRRLNVYISDPEPRRPDVLLWADASGHPVLGQMIVEADAPPDIIVVALVRTMLEPVMGEPRRPSRLSVANEALVPVLREALEPLGIKVVFGSTKVLDALVTLLETHLNTYEEGEEPPNYTHDGRIPAEEVATFFDAAAQLYEEAPWEYAYDNHVLAVDLHRWGMERVTISIMGAAGQCFGLLVFRNIKDYLALEVAGRARQFLQAEEVEPPPIDLVSIEFERGAELHSSQRQEVLANGWEVAAPHAFPTLQVIESYRFVRPLTTNDYRIGTAICLAVTAFVRKHKELFKKKNPKTTRVRVSLPYTSETKPVTVLYPHPDSTD